MQKSKIWKTYMANKYLLLVHIKLLHKNFDSANMPIAPFVTGSPFTINVECTHRNNQRWDYRLCSIEVHNYNNFKPPE